MNSASSIPIAQLRSAILRDVSRSFYLSIRILPRPLRDPVALAYLLARSTDTIADTTEIDAAMCLEKLRLLSELIQKDVEADPGLQSFCERQTTEAERRLLERLPQCLAWLRALEREDRQDIRDVLQPIVEGQMLDLERFRDAQTIRALESADELERYTYLVAGCVGEFWTRLGARHLRAFSTEPEVKMREWGVAYGKGLQLINILRDLGDDLRAGRCYLPAEQLRALRVLPSDLLSDPKRAEPVLSEWLGRAEEGMAAGIKYACALRSWRVRLATVLPALIGARTLVLLREAGARLVEQRVKVKRAEVRAILFTLLTRLAAPRAIRALHRTLSRQRK